MAQWLIACKELNGTIYVTRLPQSTGTPPIPGIPAPWTPIGPGTNPSVSEYSGNTFIVVFEYLSHLLVRAFDITTWPPVQVNPISISGGPNPPFSILIGFATGSFAEIPNDEYIFKVSGSTFATGQVRNQFDPPYLKQVLVFHDPVTHTFSVELTPDPTWKTNLPNTTNFFRLYRSPLGPVPVWTLIMDWNTTLDFIDTMADSSPFQFQYAASIGAFFNPAEPGNPLDHEESAKGPILAFNSLVGPLGFALFEPETYPLVAGDISPTHLPSSDAYGLFTQTQRFFNLIIGVSTPPPSDMMFFPGIGTSRQEVPTSSSSSMGARGGFIAFPQETQQAFPALFTDTMKFGQEVVPVTGQPPTMLSGGNAACSLFG